jgi:hypothetical protein
MGINLQMANAIYLGDMPAKYSGILFWFDDEEKMVFEWRKDGYVHREDGPAVIHDDSSKEWWLEDEILYHYRLGEYIVIEDGLRCKMKWLGKRLTRKKVLTSVGIRYLPNLPGM